MVTFWESPPKCEMYFCIHSSAKRSEKLELGMSAPDRLLTIVQP